MDRGVQFVQENFKKMLDLVEKPEYNHLKSYLSSVIIMSKS